MGDRGKQGTTVDDGQTDVTDLIPSHTPAPSSGSAVAVTGLQRYRHLTLGRMHIRSSCKSLCPNPVCSLHPLVVCCAYPFPPILVQTY